MLLIVASTLALRIAARQERLALLILDALVLQLLGYNEMFGAAFPGTPIDAPWLAGRSRGLSGTLGHYFLAAASHMFEFLRLTPMTRSGAFAETSFLVLQGINEGQKIKFAGQGESV